MEYSLSINHRLRIDAAGRELRSNMIPVTVEADLEERHSNFGFPATFTGKLVNVPLELLHNFKFAPRVEAVFRGSGYKFEGLENDGSFKLRRG